MDSGYGIWCMGLCVCVHIQVDNWILILKSHISFWLVHFAWMNESWLCSCVLFCLSILVSEWENICNNIYEIYILISLLLNFKDLEFALCSPVKHSQQIQFVLSNFEAMAIYTKCKQTADIMKNIIIVSLLFVLVEISLFIFLFSITLFCFVLCERDICDNVFHPVKLYIDTKRDMKRHTITLIRCQVMNEMKRKMKYNAKWWE